MDPTHEYLAVFTGTTALPQNGEWRTLSEAERGTRMQAGIEAWHAWMERHADRIVFRGGPIGKTKRVDTAGVGDTHNAICGFVVVRADSHADAATLFEGHPHFAILPGDGVEVMQCLATPARA